MVYINLLFLVTAGLYAALGFTLLFSPSTYAAFGWTPTLFTKLVNATFNSHILFPVWAGLMIALSSVAFYGTTMLSRHDKAKVARGLLFATLGGLHANGAAVYDAMTSRLSSDPSTMMYLRSALYGVLSLWVLVESFSATDDDATPVSAGAKRNRHASTSYSNTTINNVYLRACSLLWLLEGAVFWFSPSHMGLLGFAHPALSSAALPAFVTTSVGSLWIALATIAGYAATFQSVHNQAKVARSFLLFWLIALAYDLYGLTNSKTGAGLSTSGQYVHTIIALAFTVLSLVVSFSSVADDITVRGGAAAAGGGQHRTAVNKQT